MSLVKISNLNETLREYNEERADYTLYIDNTFKTQFNSQITIEPFSTVELISFGCRLERTVSVNLNIQQMTVEINDLITATTLGEANVTTTPEMSRKNFLKAVEDALNTIDPNLRFTIDLNSGFINQTVRIRWLSLDGITNYNLEIEINRNYTVLGFPISIITDDNPINKTAGIISAPNPMIIELTFPKNLTIELLDFATEGFDGISKFKESMIYYIPSVDWEIGDDSVYPLIKYQPNNTIRIKLNNEYQLKINSLTVRILTDEKNPLTGKISRVNPLMKRFCNLALSFKKPKEL